MKNIRSLNKFYVVALVTTLSNCGKDSGPLEKFRSSQLSKTVYVQDIAIRYDHVAPAVIGEDWQRRIVVLHKDRPVSNLTIGYRRYGEKKFQLLGITDAQGAILDSNIKEHTQYQIGQSLQSEWQNARKDLLWTSQINSDFLEKNFLALNLSPEIETRLNQADLEPVTLQIERLVIPEKDVAAWNRKAALNIVAKSIQIEGTLRAFSENCNDGSSAPSLHITSEEIIGRGAIEWAGCAGSPGAKGATGFTGSMGSDKSNGNGQNGGNGGPGSNGGPGGNGGEVFLKTKVILMNTQRISANGGAGGLAGPGGDAGRGGSGGTYLSRGFGKYMDELVQKQGKDGANGKPGAPGLPGSNGNAGDLHLSRPNTL